MLWKARGRWAQSHCCEISETRNFRRNLEFSKNMSGKFCVQLFICTNFRSRFWENLKFFFKYEDIASLVPSLQLKCNSFLSFLSHHRHGGREGGREGVGREGGRGGGGGVQSEGQEVTVPVKDIWKELPKEHSRISKDIISSQLRMTKKGLLNLNLKLNVF